MKVKNNSKNQIKVSVSAWNSDGNDKYWPLDPGKDDQWTRSDQRGYIAVLEKDLIIESYFVLYNSDIVVNEISITDHGRLILPLHSNPVNLT
ncbi:hypothetical protein LGZ99_06580 [Photorhabdus temperata]|uniref:Uncharacterized protein n=1 Tax=Photorhabdus temperata subsp. temperata Meg1 TaxID=1393735 RepID=A0A081S0T7_PHOTE|nr:hypothetical protein [Photorhabdus temperata]KER04540.1 hypothetical protein MEG1DRAFT_00829 [Photorhabdus temperata subsp. temperata Meg1]MCT8346888.1 hypothetical protein [Photorhabdus temperata]